MNKVKAIEYSHTLTKRQFATRSQKKLNHQCKNCLFRQKQYDKIWTKPKGPTSFSWAFCVRKIQYYTFIGLCLGKKNRSRIHKVWSKHDTQAHIRNTKECLSREDTKLSKQILNSASSEAFTINSSSKVTSSFSELRGVRIYFRPVK